MFNQDEIRMNYLEMTGNEPRQTTTNDFTAYWNNAFSEIDAVSANHAVQYEQVTR